jgi:hypothetical protein
MLRLREVGERSARKRHDQESGARVRSATLRKLVKLAERVSAGWDGGLGLVAARPSLGVAMFEHPRRCAPVRARSVSEIDD